MCVHTGAGHTLRLIHSAMTLTAETISVTSTTRSFLTHPLITLDRCLMIRCFAIIIIFVKAQASLISLKRSVIYSDSRSICNLGLKLLKGDMQTLEMKFYSLPI